MKKRLILAALLSVGVLVGCGNKNSSETPVSSETPSSETVSSEEVSSENTSSEVSSEEAEVVGWGTEAAPLTVAQAIEKMKDWTGTEWSETEGYVTGKIVSISKSSYGDYNAVLESSLTGKETFEIYGAYINNGVVEPVAGSTVTVKGHFTKYVQTDKDSGEPTGVVKYEIAFSKSNSYRPYIIASDAVATEPEKPSSSENTSSEPTNPSNPDDGTTAVLNVESWAAANNWTNGTAYSTISIDSVITAKAEGTKVGNYDLNTGKYYTDGQNWRIYQSENATLTISAASGYSLVSVKVTYSVKNNGTLVYNSNNIASGTVVAASGSSIQFSLGNTGSATNGQVRVTGIEVVYAAA